MNFYASFPITAEYFLSNRAINYGDGIFETMLLINGKIPFWKWHYQRLLDGLKRLNINVLEEQKIINKIYSLAPNQGSFIVKLVVFRDDNRRGYGSSSQKSQYFISINEKQKSVFSSVLGISSVRLSKQKMTAGLKHLNRLEQVLASQELNQNNYHDALMLTNNNHIIETTHKNIIFFKNNKIYTPSLKKCGVYGVALRWLKEQGFEIKTKKIELKHLSKYHGMMVCNSIVGFNSITKIGLKTYFPHELFLASDIVSLWNKWVNQL